MLRERALVQKTVVGTTMKSGSTVKKLLLKKMKQPVNAFVGSHCYQPDHSVTYCLDACQVFMNKIKGYWGTG